jgi:uncharacterized membrane protein YfhO
MTVKRAEQDLGSLMWIKLAQNGFHWHFFCERRWTFVFSSSVECLCEKSKCQQSKKDIVPWILFTVCILLYVMFDSFP